MANGTQTVSAVITADAKPFKKSVGDASKSFDGFSKSVKNFGVIAGAAILGASAAMVGFIGKSITAAAEAEAIARGLQNAAENANVFATQAGGIAGATAALKDYATTLGETIGIDDEKILGIVSQWLAVPQLASLGVDGLNNLVTVAADVAAGTNKDLDSVANAFVKVAGDGETALTKLLRLGVVFTDEQKNQYQALLDANDEIGAQNYLIEQLGTKYAGAAEAIANPFDRLKVIFGNFIEEIGTRFLPILEQVIPQVQTFLDGLLTSPEFTQFLQDMTAEFTDLLPIIFELIPKLFEFGQTVLPLLIDLLPLVGEALSTVAFLFSSTTESADGNKASLDGLTETLTFVFQAIRNVAGWLAEQKKALDNGQPSILAITGTVGLLATAFNGVSSAIQGTINWWNELWGIQQDKPISQVGSADSLDRRLTSAPATADDRRTSNYNISVNAIAPTAEVGRAVVDSLRNYQRAGGAI
jgi:hypothetical protein